MSKTPSHPPRGKTTVPVAARTNPAAAADATPLQPPQTDGAPAEEAIRARAYALWQEAGRPNDAGAEFWLRAEQELQNPRGTGG